MSKSLLLVSDNVDNSPSGICERQSNGTTNIVSGTKPNGRTFITQLGGKFQIAAVKINDKEYKMNLRTPVPVKKTITLRLVRCRYGDGATDLCWTEDQYKDLKKKLQERYAQAGVRFGFDEVTGRKVGRWGYPGRGWTGKGNFPTVTDGMIEVPDDIRELFDGYSPDVPALFLVNGIGEPWFFTVNAGYACIPLLMGRADLRPYQNKALVAPPGGANEGTRFTGPHELLHILLNAPHGGAYILEENIRQMLISPPTRCRDDISDTKRLSPRQVETIQASPFAK